MTVPGSPATAPAPQVQDEPTLIVMAPAVPGSGELVSLATQDDADGARAWFNERLTAFAHGLSHDQSGRPRSDVERRALAEAARDMIERLVSRAQSGAETGWPTDATLQPGQLLANTFYVRAMVACGGVGEIYRVRHRDLRTEHAVKILRPQHALNATLVSMLMDEGRHLLQLRHPGLVAGHGLIRDADGRLLMVMEFVRGTTLAARLRDGPLNEAELTALGTALLAALAALHAGGIVHGDLSPGNIMLEGDRSAAAKIIDFGLARRIGAAEEASALVDFAGKFSWVSPEQLRGSGQVLDSRSDLYSLGLVLAAAARGRQLEMGTDRISAIAARQAVPALDGVPPAWQPLIRSLLAPRPDKRPETASVALAELGRIAMPRRQLGRWFSRESAPRPVPA